MDEFEKYIKKNYPFIDPCCNCEYWRYMNSSSFNNVVKSSYFRKYDLTGKKRKYYGKTPDICCHYNFDNPGLKPDGAQHIDGTCDCFKPRDDSYKKLGKFKFTNWGV